MLLKIVVALVAVQVASAIMLQHSSYGGGGLYPPVPYPYPINPYPVNPYPEPWGYGNDYASLGVQGMFDRQRQHAPQNAPQEQQQAPQSRV